MKQIFLDTNIIARFFIGYIPDQKAIADDVFTKAVRGDLRLFILPEVFIEFHYVCLHHYNLHKNQIIDSLTELLELPIIEMEDKDIFLSSLNLYKDKNLSLEDSYFISYCLNKSIDFISFDKKALNVYEPQAK